MNDSLFNSMVTFYTVVPPAALLVLIVLWVFAVIRLRDIVRGWLMTVGVGVFALAIILFGGQWLLQQFELAWRLWVKLLLALFLWCAGLVVGVLTVWSVPRIASKVKKAVRSGLVAVAAVCLVIVMGFGTTWGGFWVSPATEKVTDYRGVKVVEETSHWLDEVCVIYEYHGLFVRGNRAIGPIGG